MAYILSEERDRDPVGSFRRYHAYLESERERFPPGAWALVSSDWYFGVHDHRGPHDAWLDRLEVKELGVRRPEDRRTVSIRIRLLGPYHDGWVEFFYPVVHGYRLDMYPGTSGHGDWRYDEMVLNRAGHVIHTIEWATSAIWRIEASDVELTWTPFENEGSAEIAETPSTGRTP